MNKFISLIPRYLIKNKKRTFIIALSIVISIILLVAVKAAVNALNFGFKGSAAEGGSGIYHGRALINTQNNPIKNDELIASSGYYMKIGTKKYIDQNAILEIGSYEKSTYSLLNLKLLQGKYPEKNGEIALNKLAKDKLFPDCKLGDSISVEYQYSFTDMKTDKAVTKNEMGTWKLVGILSSSRSDTEQGIGKAAISMEEAQLKSGSPMATCYFTVKNEKNAEAALDTLSISVEKINKNIKIEQNSDYLNELKRLLSIENIGIFLIIVVTIGCAAVIYNIFYITVLERIKEFSVLRAVGTSKAGLKVLILGEALVLTVVCVPFALLVGYLVIKGLFYAFISKDVAMLNALITKTDIIKISVISCLSIFISALSPAVFGGKINPIEGIKENYINNLKTKNRTNNTLKAKNIYRGINFTGSMAFINIKKFKKRLLATVISLTVSMVLVISSLYLLDIFNPQKEAKKSTGGDILLSVSNPNSLRENYGYNDKDIKAIEEIKEIKSIKKRKVKTVTMIKGNNYFTEKGKRYIKSLGEAFYKDDEYSMSVIMYGIDDSELESLKPYLKEGNLDINKSKVIVVQDLHYKNYTTLAIGDKITFNSGYQDVNDGKYKLTDNAELHVSALLNSTPIRPIDGMASVIVICSNEAMDKYWGVKDYELININVKKKSNIKAVKEKLAPIANSKNGGKITTINDENKDMNKINVIARDIFLGFSAILAVVALVNISNTISINVVMRKRELGVLRAVGMSKTEVLWMILKEGGAYGLISSILGSMLGICTSYVIYLGLRAEFLENAPFKVPWMICVLTMAVTIFFTTLVSLPSARRAVKNSIVESVKAIE